MQHYADRYVSDRYRVQTGQEFLSARSKPTDWLVDRLLPSRSMTIMVGAGGAYKSLIAQHIALSLATGRRVFDMFPVTKRRVVAYIQCESSELGLQQRFKQLIAGARMTDADVGDQLVVISNTPFQLDNPADVEWLIEEKVPELGIDLIVFDPLRDLHGRDENSSEAMKSIVDPLRKLRDERGVSSLVLHHTNKNPEYKDGSSKTRGSTALWNWMDGRWEVTPTKGWSRVGSPSRGVFLKEHKPVPAFLIKPNFASDRITFGFRWHKSADAPVNFAKKSGEARFLGIVRRIGRATIKELMEETGYGHSATNRYAQRMIAEGKLDRVEEKDGKTTRFVYFLPSEADAQQGVAA